MAEMAEANGQRIAIARNTDVSELPIGRVRARGDGRHTPVGRVQTMRRVHEISPASSMSIRYHSAWRCGCGGVESSHSARTMAARDGIVPAARAERRHRAFVVANSESKLVAGQARMRDGRLSDRWHRVPPFSTVFRLGAMNVQNVTGAQREAPIHKDGTELFLRRRRSRESTVIEAEHRDSAPPRNRSRARR